jgi:hypothetical protein
MHPHSLFADTLLRHLEREEALLRAALAGVTTVSAALRRGDLAAAFDASAQQTLGAVLREAAAERTAAATALAREVGLSGEPLALAALAAKLPAPHAAELLAARDRLAAITAEIAAVQTRNANLIAHLRSYFRGVLSDLTAPDAPLRYGPSGGRLEPALGPRQAKHGGGEQAAVQARG